KNGDIGQNVESKSKASAVDLVGINRMAAVISFSPEGRLQVYENPPDNRFLIPYGGLYWKIDDPVGKTEVRSSSLFEYVLPLTQDS
ncbi:hypothetical protein ACC687_39635, partial [Rhizobium ruizarguesonis]